jgi:hypothetical protein
VAHGLETMKRLNDAACEAVPTTELPACIEHRFTYHESSPDNCAKFKMIRSRAKEIAELIHATCPKSHEKSVAIDHLDSCVMFANASIARYGK